MINDRKGPSLTQKAPELPECTYEKWTRDDFDDDTLNLNWEFVRNPVKGNYSLTERKGYLRLWTMDGRLSLCYENGRKLQLVINRNHGEELISQVDNIKEQSIYLKVVVDKLTRSFFYSYDGEQWEPAGVLENCIYLCDEGVPDDRKRHTGTLVGIYANNGGCGSRIPADFDYFEYED